MKVLCIDWRLFPVGNARDFIDALAEDYDGVMLRIHPTKKVPVGVVEDQCMFSRVLWTSAGHLDKARYYPSSMPWNEILKEGLLTVTHRKPRTVETLPITGSDHIRGTFPLKAFD